MTSDVTNGELVEPEASALVESLRAFGYTTQAALADLIDNSISAGARNVWISFEWAGPSSYIAVRDDGVGMDAEHLRDAMRAGSRNPLLERDVKDLGRFGLGLKTASFSQCRVLTVASTHADHVMTVRRWDLDHIAVTRQWRLLSGVISGSERLLDELDRQDSGTLVVWQSMDRVTDVSPVDNERAHRRFLTLVDLVENHLAMVFHRFLDRGLNIRINGRPVTGWDPFLIGHPATQVMPEEPLSIGGHRMTARGYVLPHHSRLTTDEMKAGGGPNGWVAQQGFYVYRGNRMLVGGSWLGLPFQKADQYRLARLAIDLPNSVDHDWDIDVRKSRARPPGTLRDPLMRVARLTRERAIEVFRHRGKAIARSTSEDFVFVWQPEVLRGKIRYRVNRRHPLAETVLRGGADAATAAALVSLIEEGIPVHLITNDAAEHPDKQRSPFEDVPPDQFRSVLEAAYRTMRRQNLSPLQTRTRLATMELFREHPELIDAIDDAAVMGDA